MVRILLIVGVWALSVYGAGFWLSTYGAQYLPGPNIEYWQSGYLIVSALVLWKVISATYETTTRQMLFGIIVILVLAFLLVHPLLERLLGEWIY